MNQLFIEKRISHFINCLPTPLQVRDAGLPVADVGDDGLAPLGDVAVAPEVVKLRARELREVDAGGEHLAGAGQDDGAAVLVVRQQPEGLANLSEQKYKSSGEG